MQSSLLTFFTSKPIVFPLTRTMARLNNTVVLQGSLIVRNTGTQTHPPAALLKSAFLIAEFLASSFYRLTLCTTFGAVLRPFLLTVRHAVSGEGRQDRNPRPLETALSHRAALSGMGPSRSSHSVDPVAKVRKNGYAVKARASFESTT